ncbi:MAG: hypothetical protein ABH950_06635 [Candidatus Altiarchaeota archaeon]
MKNKTEKSEGKTDGALFFRTKIDIMIDLVNKHKKLKVSRLAKHFKTSDKRVIEWAKMLERKNVLVIYYPPLGEPEVRALREEKEK